MAIRQTSGTTFADDSFKSLHDMDAEIGGSTPNKFVPNLNLRFGAFSRREQAFLNLNRIGTIARDTGVVFTDRVRYATSTNEFDVFRLAPDGSLAWDIEFLTKPSSNVLSWALTYTPGMQFYYQPALTQQEIDEGVIRPPEVVGSYAIYINRSGHAQDATGRTIHNYRTGKLAHIMRPVAIDALGARTWADLDITNQIMTVTIPRSFLNTATYPVTLDPEFGYNSASTPASAVSLSVAVGTDGAPAPYAATAGDTITSYGVYCRTPSSGTADVVAYVHDGTDLAARAGTPATVTPNGTAQWQTSTTVSHVLSALNYGLAVGNESGAVNLYFDTGSAGDATKASGTTLDDPWSTSGGSVHNYGLYATYTAGGGVTITPNPSILTFSVPQPTLSYGGVTISPNVAVLTLAVPQPTVVYGTVVNTPDTAVFTLSVPQPVIVPGTYALTVDPAVLTFAIPNPSVSGGANIITPDSVVLTLTTPEPTVVPGAVTITPSSAVMDFSVPQPSLVVGEATVTPDSVVLEFLVPEPVIVVTGTNNPDPVVLNFAVPNPTITLGTVIVAPDSVVLTFTIPNPSVTDGSATSTGQFIFLRRRRRQQHG